MLERGAMRHAAVVCSLGLMLLGPVFAGCSTTCDSNSTSPVRYTDGHTNAAKTFYESSSPDEPFIPYPPGRQLDLVHGLSRAPDSVHVYVAFNPTGSYAQAAGNEAVIEQNAEVVSVKNDTCTTFYVRVVAWLGDANTGVGGAGSIDGG